MLIDVTPWDKNLLFGEYDVVGSKPLLMGFRIVNIAKLNTEAGVGCPCDVSR